MVSKKLISKVLVPEIVSLNQKPLMQVTVTHKIKIEVGRHP